MLHTASPESPPASYRPYLPRQQFTHHSYPDEMRQYALLRSGSAEASLEAKRMFTGIASDQLSSNALRNLRYMFVASTTLATRFAIEGGMNSDEAYDTSDRFIRAMDLTRTETGIRQLHSRMFGEFLLGVQRAQKRGRTSGTLNACLDYIDAHLNQKITLALLGKETGRSPNYLGQLFRTHLKVGLSDYVNSRRLDTAQSMLIHTDFTYAEIAESLAFSSQSYFIQRFRQATGQTPAQFRKTQREVFRVASQPGSGTAG